MCVLNFGMPVRACGCVNLCAHMCACVLIYIFLYAYNVACQKLEAMCLRSVNGKRANARNSMGPHTPEGSQQFDELKLSGQAKLRIGLHVYSRTVNSGPYVKVDLIPAMNLSRSGRAPKLFHGDDSLLRFETLSCSSAKHN